jgi:hypothetical protein
MANEIKEVRKSEDKVMRHAKKELVLVILTGLIICKLQIWGNSQFSVNNQLHIHLRGGTRRWQTK